MALTLHVAIAVAQGVMHLFIDATHTRRSMVIVIIRVARLTTERLFWHCGAHTVR